jgi:hypothetical protein
MIILLTNIMLQRFLAYSGVGPIAVPIPAQSYFVPAYNDFLAYSNGGPIVMPIRA